MGLTPHDAWATRGRTRAVLLLLALVAAAALVEAGLWWRDAGINRRIQALAGAEAFPDAPPGSAQADAPPASAPALPTEDDARELRFAAAWRSALLARQQASAPEREAALARYRPLQDDSPLGQAARYNSANLLLRQAIEVRATLQPGQAIALLELAKQSYRDVLRQDPGFWEARYNLERAQRLLPDAEEEEPPVNEPAPEAERAVTTMRGHSAGLP